MERGEGQEGHLGRLVTPPEVDPSGHSLGLRPILTPLPVADR